jgi:hypothetical protein
MKYTVYVQYTSSVSIMVFEINKQIKCYVYILKCLYSTITMVSQYQIIHVFKLFICLSPFITMDNWEYAVLKL